MGTYKWGEKKIKTEKPNLPPPSASATHHTFPTAGGSPRVGAPKGGGAPRGVLRHRHSGSKGAYLDHVPPVKARSEASPQHLGPDILSEDSDSECLCGLVIDRSRDGAHGRRGLQACKQADGKDMHATGQKVSPISAHHCWVLDTISMWGSTSSGLELHHPQYWGSSIFSVMGLHHHQY